MFVSRWSIEIISSQAVYIGGFIFLVQHETPCNFYFYTIKKLDVL